MPATKDVYKRQVITEAAKDLTPPENMFGEEEDIAEPAEESLQLEEDQEEQLTINAEYETILEEQEEQEPQEEYDEIPIKMCIRDRSAPWSRCKAIGTVVVSRAASTNFTR